MLFGKKKTAGTVFTDHYNAMLKIAKSSSVAHDPAFELLPAMFVVTDFAAVSARKDRRLIANEAVRAMESVYKGLDRGLLDRRCDLYGEIIRGKEIRGEWFMGDISAFGDNAVSKCTALLGDILYNPQCADHYDTAPAVMRGFTETVDFSTSVVMPLLRETLNNTSDSE